MSKQRAYTGTIYRFEAIAKIGDSQAMTFHIEVLAGNERAATDEVEMLLFWPLLSLKLESTKPWADSELN
jgi:hypothetical protein